MADAYIYDHVRTPRGRGKADGALHEVTPIELSRQMLNALRERNNLDTSLVDDVVLGCVAPVGEQGANIARVAAIHAGYDQSVPGKQVNRFCASALEAVNSAAAQIMSGQSDMAIGGGVESMSRIPMGADGGAWPTDPQVAFHSYFVPQGISADLIATRYGFSRQDLDAYALESQKRAAHSWDKGYFDKSVIPVVDSIGEVLLTRDEHMRPDTTMESLGGLRVAFEVPGKQAGFDSVAIQRYPDVETIQHVHTGGNSSGIVDGAAGVLLGSAEIGKRAGLKPRARIRGFASTGSEPTIMLTGPSYATEKVLKRAGMSVSDIDLFELNFFQI